MCVYSMVVDHFTDKWKDNLKPIHPWVKPSIEPEDIHWYPPPTPVKFPTQDEINDFYKLLERAKQYDKDTNQVDCELESKKKALEDLAKLLGIQIEFP